MEWNHRYGTIKLGVVCQYMYIIHRQKLGNVLLHEGGKGVGGKGVGGKEKQERGGEKGGEREERGREGSLNTIIGH